MIQEQLLLYFVLLLSTFASLPLRATDGPESGPTRIAFTIADDGLIVQGAGPGGQVAWFGVEREVDPDLTVNRRSRQGVVRAGADGVARIPLDPPPAARALWMVVDVMSGDFAAGAPATYRLIRLDPGRSPCRGDERHGDGDDGLLDDRAQIEGLMVRPGEGAWRFSGGDGGPDDDDRTHNAHLRLALPHFRPLGASPSAPRRIEGRDVWLVVDPMSMDLTVLKGGVAQ